MNRIDPPQDSSRRAFLVSGGGLLTSAFIAANLPAIRASAHHADMAAQSPLPMGFACFSAAEAATLEALSAQIIPSGQTAGAREAHAVNFIDHSFATYFSAMAADFRAGLADFERQFQAAHAGGGFAAADSATQIGFLQSVEATPFFETVRLLTILGMFSSPKYGGNFQGAGFRLLGFVDQHAFAPPFGHYDKDYPGFVPYR